jgi:hypothetical protein
MGKIVNILDNKQERIGILGAIFFKMLTSHQVQSFQRML